MGLLAGLIGGFSAGLYADLATIIPYGTTTTLEDDDDGGDTDWEGWWNNDAWWLTNIGGFYLAATTSAPPLPPHTAHRNKHEHMRRGGDARCDLHDVFTHVGATTQPARAEWLAHQDHPSVALEGASRQVALPRHDRRVSGVCVGASRSMLRV